MKTGIHFHGKLRQCELGMDCVTLTVDASNTTLQLLEKMGFNKRYYEVDPTKPEVEVTIATEEN